METRKVQLWRFVDENQQPARVVPGAALVRLLTSEQSAGADLSHTDNYGYITQLDPVPGSTPHVVTYRVRDTDLPSERRNGRIVDLNRNVQELAEGSHVFFFPHNHVAFIGNNVSPRPSRLADWLRARTGIDVYLKPVLRQDLGTALDDIAKITNIQLSISAAEVHRLDLSGFFNDPEDPLRVLPEMSKFDQGGNVRVEWSVGLGHNHDPRFFRRVFERLRGADVRGFSVAKAQVRTEEGDSVPVDFIHDKVVVELPLPPDHGRLRTLTNGTARTIATDAWQHFTTNEHVLDDIDDSTEAAFDFPATLIPIDPRTP